MWHGLQNEEEMASVCLVSCSDLYSLVPFFSLIVLREDFSGCLQNVDQN